MKAKGCWSGVGGVCSGYDPIRSHILPKVLPTILSNNSFSTQFKLGRMSLINVRWIGRVSAC